MLNLNKQVCLSIWASTVQKENRSSSPLPQHVCVLSPTFLLRVFSKPRSSDKTVLYSLNHSFVSFLFFPIFFKTFFTDIMLYLIPTLVLAATAAEAALQFRKCCPFR